MNLASNSDISYICPMILVTGGTGLLGAHLLYDLAQREQHIKAIKRNGSSLDTVRKIFGYYTSGVDDVWEKIEWIDADLMDYFSLEDAMEEVDNVYHCAAVVSFHKKDSHLMKETNIKGTRHIVNACLAKGIKKLVYVSSIAALGRAENMEITTENTAWKDSDKNSPYSLTKHGGELEVWRGIAEGLSAVIVNPSVIIGPGDWTQGSPELFSLVEKGLKFYTHGTNGYVYVRDVSKAMIELMESHISGERFIVNGEDLSYLELFNMMAKAMKRKHPSIEVKPWMIAFAWRAYKVKSWISGKPPAVTKATARSSMQSFSYSSEKLINTLDFKFTALQRAIQLTANCYKKS